MKNKTVSLKWTLDDLGKWVKNVQLLMGARLQEVLVLEQDLVLGFYLGAEAAAEAEVEAGAGAEAESEAGTVVGAASESTSKSKGPTRRHLKTKQSFLCQSLLWLWIDLKNPAALFLSRLPVSKKSKISNPALLFIKAHFLNQYLQDVEWKPEQGRVIKLYFSNSNAVGREKEKQLKQEIRKEREQKQEQEQEWQWESKRKRKQNQQQRQGQGQGQNQQQRQGQAKAGLEMEIRLFKGGQNIILTAEKKKISWFPVKELPLLDSPLQTSESPSPQLDFAKIWWTQRFENSKTNSSNVANLEGAYKAWQKAIAKKEKALNKVQEELEKKITQPWQQIGQWLVAQQSLAVPEKWTLWIDKKHSLAWNIENCFKKSKENKAKVTGTQERVKILQQELNILKQLEGPQAYLNSLSHKPKRISLPAKLQGKVKTRSLDLGQGLKVYFGRSAADNLKLLRQARAWDYWLHLEDMPSSHGILMRNRGQEVKDSLLKEAGQKLLELSLASQKLALVKGDMMGLLVTECRYVTPIKGDKLGRVTYRQARKLVLRVKF